MKRAGLIEAIAVKMDMTKVEAKTVLENLEGIIIGVQESKNENEKVKFANAEFSSKFVGERSGTSKLQGDIKPWTKKAHWEGSVKSSKLMKDMFL